jgi:hypothetical protein
MRGADVVIVRACAVDDLEAGAEQIASIRSLGTPVIDTFGVLPYTELDRIAMDPTDPILAAAHTLMVPNLDDATIDALFTEVGPGVSTPVFFVDLRQIGDEFALYAMGIIPDTAMLAAVEAAFAKLAATLAPFATGRVLMNFLAEGDAGPERTRAAYTPERFAELQLAKATYDPENRFRFNHNISPVAG